MIGVDPRPFTLRQLLWMTDGAQRERWARASAAMSVLANCHRDPHRSKVFTPMDFDPYAKSGRRRVKLDRASVGQLKEAMGI